jgi:peroxiredoxin
MKFLSISLFLLSFQALALSIGELAPGFKLTDENDKEYSLSAEKGKIVVLEWFNAECPFVKKHYYSKNMQKLQKELTDKGVIWLSINSSAPSKQGHIVSPNAAKQMLKDQGSNATHLLLDTKGTVGRTYGAQTTPHMFVIDPNGKLVYQGAIDSIASTEAKDTEKAQDYVRDAVNELMAKKPVTISQTKSYGCGVKY